MRPILGTNQRAEIDVDVSDLFKGEGIDEPLLPGDLVYVPRSFVRQFWTTFLADAIPLLPYILINLR